MRPSPKPIARAASIYGLFRMTSAALCDACVDRGEDLGGQAVEPDVGRPVVGGPVAVELGLP
jgi:hypothetical protein